MRKIGAFIWYQKLHLDGWIHKWSDHTPLNQPTQPPLCYFYLQDSTNDFIIIIKLITTFFHFQTYQQHQTNRSSNQPTRLRWLSPGLHRSLTAVLRSPATSLRWKNTLSVDGAKQQHRLWPRPSCLLSISSRARSIISVCLLSTRPDRDHSVNRPSLDWPNHPMVSCKSIQCFNNISKLTVLHSGLVFISHSIFFVFLSLFDNSYLII